MWHEARKQEKKIRGMMVDYKKRADRRQEYYQKMRKDPAQFLQIHGHNCKIHIDASIAQAAEGPATMMPWQGMTENLIDRFDVRAHLDYIPENKQTEDKVLTEVEKKEDRQTNYERYRTLVLNDFLAVSEGKFLHQIYIEERFGTIAKPDEDKKKNADKKAAIGYVYEENDTPYYPKNNSQIALLNEGNEDKEEDDLSDIDIDVAIDVNQLTNEQGKEMNQHSYKYGMKDHDFISFLYQDKEEAEQLKLARELEEEKAMYSGRKSRRERRALRDKKLQGRRVTSPPSYAARESPSHNLLHNRSSSSRSRSKTPENSGQITFITSFGDDQSEEEILAKSAAAASTTTTYKSSLYSSYSSTRQPELRSQKQEAKPENIFTKKNQLKKTSKSPSHIRDKKSVSSSSRSRSKERKPTRSRSKSNKLPSPPLKSYYRRSLSRSCSLSSSSDSTSKTSASKPKISSTSSTKPISKFTPLQRLKKKMQSQLNRHYKADKKAEQEKNEKQQIEQKERAYELRDIAIKLRQREREKRYRLLDDQSNDSDSSTSKPQSHLREWSDSSPRTSNRDKESHRRYRSRSRSKQRYRSRSRSPSRRRRPFRRSRSRSHRRSRTPKRYSTSRRRSRSPLHHSERSHESSRTRHHDYRSRHSRS